MTYSASFASRSRLSSLKLATSARSARISSTWSSEVIRGHQRSSEVIRGHQRSSEVIRGHQRSSEVIRGHQRSSGGNVHWHTQGAPEPRVAWSLITSLITPPTRRARQCHEYHGPLLLLNWQSVPISGHQCQSPVPRIPWSPSSSQLAISGNQWPSVPITWATCNMVAFLFSNLV
jgi:hypothetical protein